MCFQRNSAFSRFKFTYIYLMTYFWISNPIQWRNNDAFDFGYIKSSIFLQQKSYSWVFLTLIQLQATHFKLAKRKTSSRFGPGFTGPKKVSTEWGGPTNITNNIGILSKTRNTLHFWLSISTCSNPTLTGKGSTTSIEWPVNLSVVARPFNAEVTTSACSKPTALSKTSFER